MTSKPKRKALWLQLPKYAKTSPQVILKRKRGIPKRSKVMAKKMAVYRRVRREFLQHYPLCGVCGEKASEHVHHTAGHGPNYLKVSTWLAVCFVCHNDLHSQIEWARKHKYICEKGKWAGNGKPLNRS